MHAESVEQRYAVSRENVHGLRLPFGIVQRRETRAFSKCTGYSAGVWEASTPSVARPGMRARWAPQVSAGSHSVISGRRNDRRSYAAKKSRASFQLADGGFLPWKCGRSFAASNRAS